MLSGVKDKLLFTAALVSLLGTAVLFVYASSRSELTIDIEEIGSEHVGRKVTTKGYIASMGSYGETFYMDLRATHSEYEIHLRCEQGMLDSFEDGHELIPGALVEVSGIVEESGNRQTLRLLHSEEIEVLEPALTSFTPFDSILENPEWYEGMELKVRGEVKEIRPIYQGTLIVLGPLDEGYHRLTIEISGWYNEEMKVVRDDVVVVEGPFVYRSSKGTWMIRSDRVPAPY